MNQRQRVAVFSGSLLIAAMLLFPPMRGYHHHSYMFVFGNRRAYFKELDLQLSTGRFLPEMNGWVTWTINKERLIFQVMITTVLTIGTTVLLGGKRD